MDILQPRVSISELGLFDGYKCVQKISEAYPWFPLDFEEQMKKQKTEILKTVLSDAKFNIPGDLEDPIWMVECFMFGYSQFEIIRSQDKPPIFPSEKVDLVELFGEGKIPKHLLPSTWYIVRFFTDWEIAFVRKRIEIEVENHMRTSGFLRKIRERIWTRLLKYDTHTN